MLGVPVASYRGVALHSVVRLNLTESLCKYTVVYMLLGLHPILLCLSLRTLEFKGQSEDCQAARANPVSVNLAKPSWVVWLLTCLQHSNSLVF